MDKHILIIGAGIAGLAAGCYARMNGYRATIFELHDLPGGLCTAWERKGYVFDGCIHYLFGSGEGQPFHAMWQELGAAQNRPMINHAEYQRITDGEHTLIVYTDPDRLQAHSLFRSVCRHAVSSGTDCVVRLLPDGARSTNSTMLDSSRPSPPEAGSRPATR
jgi:phytoene dehydrogenase-like protein